MTSPAPVDRRAVTAVLDLSRRSLWVPAVLSAVLAVLAVVAGGLDDGLDGGAGAPRSPWPVEARAGVVGGLPYWWTTVLYVLVALGCWVRARVERLRRRYRGLPGAGAAPRAWTALGALLVLLSVDHVLGLHKALSTGPVAWLPGPLAEHPVQAALVVVGLPVVLGVLAAATPGQRALIVAAGVAYLTAGLVLDPRLVVLPGSRFRTEAVETGLEWLGALVLLLAALQRVRMRGDARAAAARPAVGSGVLEAVAVVDRLRSPGGDAWFAAQTPASLARYCVEEAHEVVEALETGDQDALRDELGDLLLQVLLHARIAGEHARTPFDVDDVAAALVRKLVRRHPHVFDPALRGRPAPTVAELEDGWEQHKSAEGSRPSVFDGVPVTLPALQRAEEVLERTHRAGLPAPRAAGVAPDAVGEHLLAVVQAARDGGVDPEAALREAARRAEEAGRAAERA